MSGALDLWVFSRLQAGLLALALLFGCRAAQAADSNYRAELGPYFGQFTSNYGRWYGAHGRLWLLDVTGQKGYSGYLEMVDLHWRPEQAADPLRKSNVDTTFVSARGLRYWNDNLYTFATLGGTIGDSLFPRVQIEFEADYIVPQHNALVVAFGGGYRRYTGIDRPYLILGASYSLPKTAFLYHLWASSGIAAQYSATHLLTWVYGERLKSWWRLDLLWGDETHPSLGAPLLFNTFVQSKAFTLSYELWLLRNFGLAFAGSITQSVVRENVPTLFHRWLFEIRPFFTF